ncbi:unnamed protein product [Orchesella dallaii]|uniref:C-terminal-binding protein n=1 Tax=Orchesella dallaii TaxID=48710 RepID=A0ABP1RKI3_9HEXA
MSSASSSSSEGNQASDYPTTGGDFHYEPGCTRSDHRMCPSAVTRPIRPIVAQFEERDCTYEMNILGSIAQVEFCNAKNVGEIHDPRVLHEAVGIFVRNGIQLGKEELAKFEALKFIVKIGSGLTKIDLKSAGEMGIAVSHITGFGIEEAADSALRMILNCFRRTLSLQKSLTRGYLKDCRSERTRSIASQHCIRVRGKTLGLIGFGQVAKAVAVRAVIFGLKVMFYDPYITNGNEISYGIVRAKNLGDLLTQSDCVSLHCSLKMQNYFLVDATTIQLMRHGACLVNISDESLIENSALANGLRDGRIRTAALQVSRNFDGAAFNGVPNLYRTTKIAQFSEASLKEFREAAATEMKAYLEEGMMSEHLQYLRNGMFIGVQ